MADDPAASDVLIARVIAGVGAFVWAGLFYGVIDLAVVIEQTPGFAAVYLLETGWGLLFTVLVAVPLAVLAVRPWLPALLLQVTAVGFCVGVAALVGAQLWQLLPAMVLVLNAAFVADLARGSVRPSTGWRPPRPDAALIVAVVVAAPVALLYATETAAAAREGRRPTDTTWGLDHWAMQAALPLAVLATASLVAAGVRQRWGGTLVAAWSVGLSTAWLGAVSIAYPEHAASLGQPLGGAAITWGAAFVLLASLRWWSLRGVDTTSTSVR